MLNIPEAAANNSLTFLEAGLIGFSVCYALSPLLSGNAANRCIDAEVATAPGNSGPPSYSGLHVLIVDDEPLNLRVLERQLTRLGVTGVVKAKNGLEALDAEASSEKAFDAIICDLQVRSVHAGCSNWCRPLLFNGTRCCISLPSSLSSC